MVRSARIGSTLLAAALALTLAACSSGDSSEEATAAESTSEAATEEAVAEETTEAAADEAATEDTAAQEPDGALASCIVGAWSVSEESLREQMNTLLGESMPADLEMTITGTSDITFTEAELSISTDNSVTIAMGAGETAIEMTNTSVGSATMTYTLSGTTLTIGEVTAAEGTVTSTSSGGGVDPVTQETAFEDSMMLAAGTSQNASCDGDTLTLSASAGEITVDTVYNRK